MASQTVSRAQAVVSALRTTQCVKALPAAAAFSLRPRQASSLAPKKTSVIKQSRSLAVQAQADGAHVGLPIDLRGEFPGFLAPAAAVSLPIMKNDVQCGRVSGTQVAPWVGEVSALMQEPKCFILTHEFRNLQTMRLHQSCMNQQCQASQPPAIGPAFLTD